MIQVAHIKDYLPQSCPHGDSMILDSEVLLVDVKTGDPLPFGTLGVHKVHHSPVHYYFNQCRKMLSKMLHVACSFLTCCTSMGKVYWTGNTI